MCEDTRAETHIKLNRLSLKVDPHLETISFCWNTLLLTSIIALKDKMYASSPSKGRPGAATWGTSEEWAWLSEKKEVFKQRQQEGPEALHSFWPWIETEFLKRFPERTHEYLHPESTRRANPSEPPDDGKSKKKRDNNVSAIRLM